MIPARKIFFLLISIMFFLIIMNYFPNELSVPQTILNLFPEKYALRIQRLFQSSTIHDRFELNAEANIPTWFSTILLFTISLISLVTYSYCDEHFRLKKFWLIFSCVYCYLSIDEAARFHEILDLYIFKWVYIYAPFGALFFILCIFYLHKSDDKVLRNFIIGGLIIYASGGLVCETISSRFAPLPPVIQEIEYISEECLEMVGTIIVLMGCIRGLNRHINHNVTEKQSMLLKEK